MMNLLENNTLRLSLFQDGPQTIVALIHKTGGMGELMEFFQWMYDSPDPREMVPHLLQGDDDGSTEYQGQPVVWDGTFSLNDNGEIIYSGWAGVSGYGGEVQRVVKVTDLVMTG